MNSLINFITNGVFNAKDHIYTISPPVQETRRRQRRRRHQTPEDEVHMLLIISAVIIYTLNNNSSHSRRHTDILQNHFLFVLIYFSFHQHLTGIQCSVRGYFIPILLWFTTVFSSRCVELMELVMMYRFVFMI